MAVHLRYRLPAFRSRRSPIVGDNRATRQWLIDQYQVSEDPRSGIKSDPNRDDDPEYIVRLVGQVVRVSVETVEAVKNLPAEFGG